MPALETGDDLPDVSKSSSPKRETIGASKRPVTFVLTDPTAAGAFWLSVLPTWRRTLGRKDEPSTALETTDSVGLVGRGSGPVGVSCETGEVPSLARVETAEVRRSLSAC